MKTRLRYGRDVGIIRPRNLKTMIHMLRALMDIVENMQEQIADVS